MIASCASCGYSHQNPKYHVYETLAGPRRIVDEWHRTNCEIYLMVTGAIYSIETFDESGLGARTIVYLDAKTEEQDRKAFDSSVREHQEMEGK